MNKQFIITDPVGLHARPATLLVSEAGKFASQITVTVEDKSADLKSVMGVMALAIANGQEITVSAEGDDAAQAVEALAKIITDSNIGEEK